MLFSSADLLSSMCVVSIDSSGMDSYGSVTSYTDILLTMKACYGGHVEQTEIKIEN